MTDFITYREVREITIRLPRDDYEAEHSYGEDIVKATVVSREEIGRRHEVDYALGTDLEAELYYLLADGERIFESRSHDAVVEHCASLGDDVSRIFRFGDLDEPDKSWKIMADSRAAAAKAGTE
ncbi:hypothetical protein [Paenarthrobacter sp. YJN-5]|uniref:hypothetical protein n=1 Tax=Paenarthrobacter sp. YJN-5 TaxID=2735316 RepID=UPI00187899F3|nr:hypothetical protein [Paenarthrobacter sp. YJN-5]QOT19567.1 hypothetical protein HMI59_23365 [Paenarthrobacter sp. YJN-5]